MKDIKMPSLYEYVGMPYGDDYESTATTDAEITQKPPRTHPVGDDWISPEELKASLDEIIASTDDFMEAKTMVHELLDKYPYVHEELGEIEGRDYYEDVINDFIANYGDQF